ncbi:hypothetical protein BB561_001546 [Smittium simulii]|uniref:Uncharacterized protein n=1 Tax=Smittium simulii TaxID=133385 RepID=A0A2T9YU51_9FUNG|nr:hypothetical protein BB561_001546 [Smittium simulii]
MQKAKEYIDYLVSKVNSLETEVLHNRKFSNACNSQNYKSNGNCEISYEQKLSNMMNSFPVYCNSQDEYNAEIRENKYIDTYGFISNECYNTDIKPENKDTKLAALQMIQNFNNERLNLTNGRSVNFNGFSENSMCTQLDNNILSSDLSNSITKGAEFSQDKEDILRSFSGDYQERNNVPKIDQFRLEKLKDYPAIKKTLGKDLITINNNSIGIKHDTKNPQTVDMVAGLTNENFIFENINSEISRKNFDQSLDHKVKFKKQKMNYESQPIVNDKLYKPNNLSRLGSTGQVSLASSLPMDELSEYPFLQTPTTDHTDAFLYFNNISQPKHDSHQNFKASETIFNQKNETDFLISTPVSMIFDNSSIMAGQKQNEFDFFNLGLLNNL